MYVIKDSGSSRYQVLQRLSGADMLTIARIAAEQLNPSPHNHGQDSPAGNA